MFEIVKPQSRCVVALTDPHICPFLHCPFIFPPLPFSLKTSMSWLFLEWFVPVYLLVSVLVLAGFGACLYFLEPGLQDAHKWSSNTVRHHPLVASVNCRDDDTNALIWAGRRGAVEDGHLCSRVARTRRMVASTVKRETEMDTGEEMQPFYTLSLTS